MSFKKLSFFIILILVSVSFLSSKISTGIKRRVSLISPKVISKKPSFESQVPIYLTNDSLHYANQILSIKTKKLSLKIRYFNSNTIEERKLIINEASDVLYSNLVDSLIPYWYGTPWDYNGISQKPGKGKIACGYFVFTLLRDAGINLPRVKMSQAASEQTIKSLVSSSEIKRYSNLNLTDFIEKMKTRGNGVYLLGLDNHVGLYQVKDEESWFLHSTVIYPSCVIKEKASESPALEYSSYRVAGKLSYNADLTKQWLFNEYVDLK